MAAAIADIAVIVIDYQVPVPEQYGSTLLEPSVSFCSDLQVPQDEEFKNHLLNDPAFLAALRKAMRIKVIPSAIHQQLELHQTRIRNQQKRRKRKENETENDVDSTNRPAKKLKASPLQVNNISDKNGVSNDIKDCFYDARTSEHDEESTVSVSFVSQSGRSKEEKKENATHENPALEGAQGLNKESLDSERSGKRTAISGMRKEEMKKYVIGNGKVFDSDHDIHNDDTFGKGGPHRQKIQLHGEAATEDNSEIVNEHKSKSAEEDLETDNEEEQYGETQSRDEAKFRRITKEFLQNCELLKEYKAKHGDCKVPVEVKQGDGKVSTENTSNDSVLGIWVRRTRYNGKLFLEGHRSGKINMSEKRFRILDGIGFDWYTNVPWDEFLSRLIRYKEKHGHCNVPRECEEDRLLGIMADTMRQHAKMFREGRKTSSFTKARKKTLDEIGFTWCEGVGET